MTVPVDGQPSPRWLWGALAGYVALLIAAGLLLHPIKAIGVENDGYVEMAEALLAGHLPRDPFRPLLFPLATAGAGWLVGDCFVGAKIVSAAAAGLLVAATFVLTDRCAGRPAAPLASALVAGNGAIVTHGMLASGDLLGTSLVVAALAAIVRVWDRPSAGRLVAAGACCAAAWFARYQAVLLLLPLVLACATPAEPGTGWSRRLLRLAVVLGTAALCLVPHFLLTHAVFGTIVHDENWRSVELKYLHGMVFSRAYDATLGSVFAVLAHDPSGVFARSLQDLGDYVCRLLVEIVQGSAGPTVYGYVLSAIAAAGVVRLLARRGSAAWLPASYLAVHAVAVCVTFVPMTRLALVNVPVACIGVASVVASLRGTRLDAVRAAASCGLLAGALWHAAVALGQLGSQHPWPEVQAVERLSREATKPFRVLTSYAYLATRLRPHCCVATTPLYPGEDLAPYGERVVAAADARGAAYVLFGRVSCGDEAFARLAAWSHARVRVVERTGDVVLFEVADVALDWVARVDVEPRRLRGGTVRVAVVLRDDVPPEDVGVVGVRLRGPDGEPTFLPLRRADDGIHRGAIDVASAPRQAPEVWTVEPMVGSRTGRLGGGPRVAITLE